MTRKSTCCEEPPRTTIPASDKVISQVKDGSSPIAIEKRLSEITFAKSSAAMDSSQLTDIKMAIQSEYAEGRGVEIIGYAYNDEDSPQSLADSRATLMQEQLGRTEGATRTKGVVMNRPYNGENAFVDFKEYDLEAVASEARKSAADGQILVEGKRTYFFLDAVGSESALSSEVKWELGKISGKLYGNFCKIRLTSYNDDRANGNALTYHMQEYLIRSGISPSRIIRRNRAKGNRDESIVELRILD